MLQVQPLRKSLDKTSNAPARLAPGCVWLRQRGSAGGRRGERASCSPLRHVRAGRRGKACGPLQLTSRYLLQASVVFFPLADDSFGQQISHHKIASAALPDRCGAFWCLS